MNGMISPFGYGFGFSMKTFDDYNKMIVYPQEMELISPRTVEKRRIEFCLGRAAAHSALEQINICNIPILKGTYNEPLWPRGVVGAISHSGEIAVAAVALKENAAGIGIDIEMLDSKISEDLIQQMCTIREADWVNKSKVKKIERMLMIFSAKESAFKGLFPITNIFLDYLDAELIWDEDTDSFVGTLLKNAGGDYNAGYLFEVGCRRLEKYVFTYMKLPPPR